MNKFKKSLEDQQRIDEALKAICNLFTDCRYASYVEEMAEAQTQIIGLMEMAKQQAAIHDASEEIQTNDIAMFLMDMSAFFKVLRPFADMLNESNKD